LLLRNLARGERAPAALEAEAKLIVRHTDRLAELLTTLFDLSCLESGLLHLSRSQVDLASLARELAESLRPVTGHFVKVVAERSVTGNWDGGRLRQVLMNLLSNARKYWPQGSSLTVTAYLTGDERTTTVRGSDKGTVPG